MNDISKSQILLDQSYFQETQKYKNRSSAYIPTSYGSQYAKYHDNETNKPFAQQKGDYLYDLYPKVENDTQPIQFLTPQMNPQKTFFRSGLDQSKYIDFQDQSVLNDTLLNKSYLTQQTPTNRNILTSNGSFFNQNNYNTFSLGNQSPRKSKRNILTEHALQHPSIFNTIARDSIFTNISYQANKDYDNSYDSREGFCFKIDCIELSFPATQIKSLQLSFSLVDKETEQTFFSESRAKELFYKDIYKTKQMINFSRTIPNFLINNNYYFIIRADYELFDVENRIVSFFSTFTLIPIFLDSKLNSGRHKLKFLEYSTRTHPIKQTKGYSFPAADHLNCYIRICRPNTKLDVMEAMPVKRRKDDIIPQIKEDNSTLRQERYELDGYWSQKLKKQEEEELQKQIQYYQKHKQYKKPSNKPNKFNIAYESKDLVKPSKYAGFLTSVPRKPIKAEIQRGHLRIDRYV